MPFFIDVVEQLAIQQQIELLQQQQQQIQATQQQYLNMGMMPPNQAMAGGFNPLQQNIASMAPQAAFQFPAPMAQQNVNVGGSQQPLSHRRNQSALPGMPMGPPPAPSSGASGSSYGNDGLAQGRENNAPRGGRGGGSGGGGGGHGHQRRHSLVVGEAKKAAEAAQQKRTTAGFQFPAPGASTSTEKLEESPAAPAVTPPAADAQAPAASSFRGGRGGAHGRSQSLAVGAAGRGGRGGKCFFPSNIAFFFVEIFFG